MTFEERQDVIIVKGAEKEIEEYKAKHGLTRGEGVCIMASDIPAEEILQTGFYKEKIKQLEKEKADLQAELDNQRKEALTDKVKIKEQTERIDKLEKALIEATIR